LTAGSHDVHFLLDKNHTARWGSRVSSSAPDGFVRLVPISLMLLRTECSMRMKHPMLLLSVALALFCHSTARSAERPIKIFGYFQNTVQHQKQSVFDIDVDGKTFLVQQLNLFFQKDLFDNWTTLVDIEMINTYSSQRHWGALNLEEAWVRYRLNKNFNLKLGLQIPIYNNLNEIKNRTPLLPYILRPLVYENSLSEIIPVEEFYPQWAFVQAYGFIPSGGWKVDYALYIGNSPNINNDPDLGQTGVDTTETYLAGSRVGIRYKELKAGVSATYDQISLEPGFEQHFNVRYSDLELLPRTRLGGDLSFALRNLYFEGELIFVHYDEAIPDLTMEAAFYYGTLGYYIWDKLFLYFSYWYLDSKYPMVHEVSVDSTTVVTNVREFTVPGAGAAFRLNDRITFKAQYAPLRETISIPPLRGNREQFFYYGGLAVSVFF
jgi:hypothetical protein